MGLENAGCLDYEVIRKIGIKGVYTVTQDTTVALWGKGFASYTFSELCMNGLKVE